MSARERTCRPAGALALRRAGRYNHAAPNGAGLRQSSAVQEFHNVAVTWFLTVTETPPLTAPIRNADGSVQLILVGAAGLAFRVETSSNLVDWTPLVTITNRARTEIIVDTNAANFQPRFYRALTP